MSKYDMCEAMYALTHGMVVSRRRSLLPPLVVTTAGVAMFVINLFIEPTADNSNLKSAIVLFAAIFVGVGVVYAMVRRMGRPFHTKDGCFLSKKEYKFFKERKAEVVDLVKRRDFATLRSLPTDGVSAVTVVMYTSPQSGFCAAQVFEYEEMEIHPATELIWQA